MPNQPGEPDSQRSVGDKCWELTLTWTGRPLSTDEIVTMADDLASKPSVDDPLAVQKRWEAPDA